MTLEQTQELLALCRNALRLWHEAELLEGAEDAASIARRINTLKLAGRLRNQAFRTGGEIMALPTQNGTYSTNIPQQ